jgi:hypothetical protein
MFSEAQNIPDTAISAMAPLFPPTPTPPSPVLISKSWGTNPPLAATLSEQINSLLCLVVCMFELLPFVIELPFSIDLTEALAVLELQLPVCSSALSS